MPPENASEDEPLDLYQRYGEQIEKHRDWLIPHPHLLKGWEKRMRSTNGKEGAICEALLRLQLALRVERVEPGEGADGSGPDFLCFAGDKQFYVECNCIGIDTATRKTGISEGFRTDSKGGSFAFLTSEIQRRCINKGRQLGRLSGTVRLLAIGTLHDSVGSLFFDDRSAEFVLTSEPTIAFDIETDIGPPVRGSRQVTDLSDSAFLKSNMKNPTNPFIDEARQYLSGILLAGFAYEKPITCGVLHPDPACVFDRSLLPDIHFCRLKDGWRSGKFEVEWV